MKKDDLLDAIGMIDEKYVEEAEAYFVKAGQKSGENRDTEEKQKTEDQKPEEKSVSKTAGWRKVFVPVVSAACLCLVIGGVWAVNNSFNGGKIAGSADGAPPAEKTEAAEETTEMEDSFGNDVDSSAETAHGSQMWDGDEDESMNGSEQWFEDAVSYQMYDGPVLPLTMADTGDDLAVTRNVQLNLMNDADSAEENAIMILAEDSYQISNTSTEDITADFYYPFIANMSESDKDKHPELTLDGEKLSSDYIMGAFSENMDLTELDNFNEVAQLLSDGDYLERSVAEPQSPDEDTAATDLPVTVYTATYKSEDDTPGTEITLHAKYDLPDQRTMIFSDGMYSYGYEDGTMYIDYSQDLSDGTLQLVVLGGSVENLQITVIREDEDITNKCDITLKKTESTLGAVIREQVHRFCEEASDVSGNDPYLVPASDYTEEALCESVMNRVLENRMNQDPGIVYGLQEIVQMAVQHTGIQYAKVEITIPAESTVSLEAKMEKGLSANYDRHKMGLSKYQEDASDWYGLEVARSLGSRLYFQEVTAELSLAADILSKEDNFIPSEDGTIRLTEEYNYLRFVNVNEVQQDEESSGGIFRRIRDFFSRIFGGTRIRDDFRDAKPVIYLYPEEETQVSVRLDLDGELCSTWPEYETDTGWQITALPDGTLYDEEGNEYSYLFWDGRLDMDCDFSKGFVVKGSDSAEFLREKLSYMGLSPEEYNEFIVYWAPILEEYPYNLISFQWKNYEQAAALEITPEPDRIFRVYMAYTPLQRPQKIKEQELPILEREGFTVVEWGGRRLD